jgi:hypothetical protein
LGCNASACWNSDTPINAGAAGSCNVQVATPPVTGSATCDSAIAQQCRIRSLPSLWLYEDGELVSKETREVVAALSRHG